MTDELRCRSEITKSLEALLKPPVIALDTFLEFDENTRFVSS